MIKSISVVNYLGESLKLVLTDSHENTGIYVKSVTGIGPSKANINTVNLASDDGGIYNSARSEVRNITLTLGFYQSQSLKNSIEDSRHLTYRYFPNKKPLTLIFETDNRSLYIDGYVESNEPDIFSDQETTTISVICPDPNFYDANGKTTVDFSAVRSTFKFPFSNESLTEDLILFGEYLINTDRDLYYYGDEDTGVTIKIQPTNRVWQLRIVNTSTNKWIDLDDYSIFLITGGYISAYDEIYICTIKGKKSAILVRDGKSYNIINALGRDPEWFQLTKGVNVFAYYAYSGVADTTLEISYENAYSGV